MRAIFLGRPIHWLILLAIIALGWIAGRYRLHVTEFNLFVIASIAIVVVVVVAILATSRPGDRITRDPLVDE